MPSPVGHTIAGFAISQLSKENPGRHRLYRVGVCLFMAIAPDLDFLPGVLLNRPALFHGDLLHSLGSALVVSLFLASILRVSGKPFGQVFSLGFLAYLSHLVLDMLQPDGRIPYGIPFLWPLSEAYFLSPAPILLGVHHVSSTSATTLEFIRGVLHPHNLLAIAVEVLILTPFVFWRRWFANQKTAHVSQMRFDGDWKGR